MDICPRKGLINPLSKCLYVFVMVFNIATKETKYVHIVQQQTLCSNVKNSILVPLGKVVDEFEQYM